MEVKKGSSLSEHQEELIRSDFRFVEYHEAANSYANGVEIGFRGLRAFLIANGIFLAFFSAPESGNIAELAKSFSPYIPYAGFIISIILFISAPLYNRHLDNCLLRCVELESELGGKLFTRMYGIGKGKESESIGAMTALRIIALFFTAIWIWIYFFQSGVSLNVIWNFLYDGVIYMVDVVVGFVRSFL